MDTLRSSSLNYGYLAQLLLEIWIPCAAPALNMDTLRSSCLKDGYLARLLLEIWIPCGAPAC